LSHIAPSVNQDAEYDDNIMEDTYEKMRVSKIVIHAALGDWNVAVEGQEDKYVTHHKLGYCH